MAKKAEKKYLSFAEIAAWERRKKAKAAGQVEAETENSPDDEDEGEGEQDEGEGEGESSEFASSAAAELAADHGLLPEELGEPSGKYGFTVADVRAAIERLEQE